VGSKSAYTVTFITLLANMQIPDQIQAIRRDKCTECPKDTITGLIRSNIPLSKLPSNVFNIYSSMEVRNHILKSYKTIVKTVLYIF